MLGSRCGHFRTVMARRPRACRNGGSIEEFGAVGPGQSTDVDAGVLHFISDGFEKESRKALLA